MVVLLRQETHKSLGKPSTLAEFVNNAVNTEKKSHIKKKQAHFFDRSILLEESGNPQLVHQLLIFTVFVVVGFLAWATVTKVDEVALAPGSVLPSGKVRHLQHKDGGILRQIYVKENQRVEEGQVLLELEKTELHSKSKAISADLDLMKIRQEFLASFLEKRDWELPAELSKRHPNIVKREGGITTALKEKVKASEDVLKSKTLQAESDLALVGQRISFLKEKVNLMDSTLVSMKKSHEKNLKESAKERSSMLEEVGLREKLIDRGLNSKLNILGLKRQMAGLERSLSEKEQAYNSERNGHLKAQLELREELATLPLTQKKMKQALGQARSDHEAFLKSVQLERLEELRDLSLGIVKLTEEATRVGEQLERTRVLSPIAGRVQNISVYTVGGVLAPGSLVMDVIPLDEGLVAEVEISTRDIGHVEVGHSVRIKFDNYDFSKYGYIDAILEDISPTTVVGEAGEHFCGLVKIPREYLDENKKLFPIQPGMQVTGDIVSGHKRIIEYLLKPIFSTAQQALRER